MALGVDVTGAMDTGCAVGAGNALGVASAGSVGAVGSTGASVGRLAAALTGICGKGGPRTGGWRRDQAFPSFSHNLIESVQL